MLQYLSTADGHLSTVISGVSKPLHEMCFRVALELWVLFWKGISVDTTWASVNTLSQNSPDDVLGRPLVSTLLGLVSTHCPRLARRGLVRS
ncbi:hypothetical protein Taro_044000 [Colocasia esculenta]|uniref:Uncharacterized protein n=1 Tax=Colocasia esculenta TaxID=4460 RepID=A0A843WSU3_COLES|nr:hypothetical protein [Colocasia esculenta]